MSIDDIDWSGFDKYPEDTCTCAWCDEVYRSHGKSHRGKDGVLFLVPRTPCPRCGGRKLQKISSDPEVYSLSRK